MGKAAKTSIPPEKRRKMPLHQIFSLITSYASAKIGAQIKAVAFIVIYLFLAQTYILRMPVQHALAVAVGVGTTVLGLAFFLEGLFLGIMPLGEQCGLRLPQKAGIWGVAVFAIIVGVTATLAEPAIGFLKIQGSAVEAWDAPLLYLLLNRGANWLVLAIASGVGLAVLLGMFRFIYGWTFKPAVFLSMPLLLLIGLFFEHNPILRPVANLAWDTGGVTTGPVTVPLVIALGIGVSKIASGKEAGSSGLGVVTLASALPILMVFILAFALFVKMPNVSSASEFFAPRPETRARAEYVAGGAPALTALAESAARRGFLTAAQFRAYFPDAASAAVQAPVETQNPLAMAETRMFTALKDALWAVLPLTLVLVVAIWFVIRERIHEADIAALGVVFTILGMFLFSLGMERGISALGSQAGAALPRAYTETLQEPVIVQGDNASVFTVSTPQGPREYIWIQRETKQPEAVPLDRANLDARTNIYRYTPVENAVFAGWGRTAGLVVVLLFVYVLGFGATLAEPSLSALGTTVEELTTGTYKKATLITTVAIGVGFGMVAGFSRILFDLPLIWILIASYIPVLILTIFADEDFSAIAWDCAGVTTGPVTVPLVIAAGLSIGREAGVSGGAFGVVAAASVFPILAVLISGIINQLNARKSITESVM